MMQTDKKIKLLLWAVALLALLNITTIITIVYGNINRPAQETTIAIDSSNSPLNSKVFKDELCFNNDQMDLYKESNIDFRNKANEILTQIEILKGKLFKELQNSKPDRKRTREISDSIGIAHANLKEATVDFYIKLKECCNGEQNESLKKMFSPLFENRGHRNMGGRGGNVYRHGNKNQF